MPRSRSDADAMFDALSEFFTRLPLWLGPVAAGLAYLVIRYIIAPLFKSLGTESGKLIGQLLIELAWLGGVIILAAWIVSLADRTRRRLRFDQQTGLKTIRQLSWREFESLIGEALRRQGYAVKETGQPGPDGGVDLVLTKDGEETLVQCKRWKEWQVGVEKVRELYGIMASRGSTGGILVSCGSFTMPARRFAEGKSLRLIDGPMLAQLVAGIQTKAAPAVKATKTMPETLSCPECGSSMVLRTARKGPQPGSQFWGCTKYPACRGKRPYEAT